MHQDQRYEHALAAALAILEEIDRLPDLPKSQQLAMAVYAILHEMNRYEAERSGQHVEFSAN